LICPSRAGLGRGGTSRTEVALGARCAVELAVCSGRIGICPRWARQCQPGPGKAVGSTWAEIGIGGGFGTVKSSRARLAVRQFRLAAVAIVCPGWTGLNDRLARAAIDIADVASGAQHGLSEGTCAGETLIASWAGPAAALRLLRRQRVIRVGWTKVRCAAITVSADGALVSCHVCRRTGGGARVAGCAGATACCSGVAVRPCNTGQRQ